MVNKEPLFINPLTRCTSVTDAELMQCLEVSKLWLQLATAADVVSCGLNASLKLCNLNAASITHDIFEFCHSPNGALRRAPGERSEPPASFP